MNRFFCLLAAFLLPGTLSAATVVTDGSVVGGSLVSASLTAGPDVSAEPNATISNDGSGNLLFTPGLSDTNTDWYLTFKNLGIDPTVHQYVQVDFISVTVGAVSSPWSMFHTDNDSSIGGANNSTQSLGIVTLQPTPFSVVVDLAAGGTGNTTWGPGTVNNLRFDLFEGDNANKGKTFTISAVTFGSELVPEPSTGVLALLGSLGLLRRRR